MLLLGVTYKADIADQRESPAVDVARSLRTLGAMVDFHDPHVREWTADGMATTCVPDLEAALVESDVAVLLQAHRAYDRQALGACGTRILDTRGVLSGPLVTRL